MLKLPRYFFTSSFGDHFIVCTFSFTLLKAWYFIQNIVYRPLQCCWWRCSKRLWSGEICCFFSFLFYHLRFSHVGCMVSGQLQNTLWNSNSKELGTRKFIKKIIIPAKLDLFYTFRFPCSLTIVSNQSNHNVVPLILATFFDNLQRGYIFDGESLCLWSWVIVVEFWPPFWQVAKRYLIVCFCLVVE